MSWSFQPEIEWNGMDNINYDTAEVMSPMLHVQSPWLFQAGTEKLGEAAIQVSHTAIRNLGFHFKNYPTSQYCNI
jgi:hypothetical protein